MLSTLLLWGTTTATATSNPEDNIPTNGLIAWYKLEETSGQTMGDSSPVGTNSGTLGSTTGADTNDPAWVTPTGGGLVFDGVDLGGAALVGVITGTGWAAATMGFHVSMDNATYARLYDTSGAVVTSTNTGAFALAVNPQLTAGWKFVKVLSSANQVNQSIVLVKRPV